MKYFFLIFALALPFRSEAQTVTEQEVREAVTAAIRELKIESRFAQKDSVRTEGRVGISKSLFNPSMVMKRVRWSLRYSDTLVYQRFIEHDFVRNQFDRPVRYTLDSTWTKLPVIQGDMPVAKWGDYRRSAVWAIARLGLPVFSVDKMRFLIAYSHSVYGSTISRVVMFSRQTGDWRIVKTFWEFSY